MKLTVIGCSPAWPNPGGAQSGYLVEGSGRLLLDCGPGVLSRLRVREAWPRIDAIALTHLHLDHTADLIGWLWGTLMGPGRGTPKPELWLPPGGRQGLTTLADNLDDAFHIREYGGEFAAAGYRITPVAVRHRGAYGLRVTDGTSTLAFSADSGPTPALVELARDVDLFLCEATNADGDESDAHLTAAQARSAATEAGARRLVLTHRPAELQSAGDDVAYDGLELEL